MKAITKPFAVLMLCATSLANASSEASSQATENMQHTHASSDANKATNKAKVMVFWASWCSACNNALSALSQLNATNSDTEFVAVNVLDNAPVAKSLADKGYPQLDWLDADAELAQAHGVKALPWTVVTDSNGALLSSQAAIGTAEGLIYRISSTLAVGQSLALAE